METNLNILLIITSVLSSSFAQKSDCRTNGGVNPNKDCVFPFTYEGITYFGCPKDLNDPTKTWCSTKTDSTGNHVTGQNEYGFCNDLCPRHECKTVGGPKPNARCVFPFKFQGEIYNGCPVDLEDPSKRWCSTKVDANGEHVTGAGEFGHCGPDCPVHGPATPTIIPASCPGNELCRPFIMCSALVSPEEARSKLCSLESGSSGVCCKEVTSLDGDNDIITRKIQVRIDDSAFDRINNAAVLRAVGIGESYMRNVTELRSLTNILPRSQTKSAEFQHAKFMKASPGIVERGRVCLIAMETARNLAKDLGMADPQSINEIDFSRVDTKGSILERSCPPTPVCNPNSKYRTVDGSCNNLRNPKLGMAGTPLQRLLPNAYADGLLMPRIAKNGGPLPSPRVITNGAIRATQIPEKTFTLMIVGLGQFIDHDFDHVPISTNENDEMLQCCTEDGRPAPGNDPSLCFPFLFPLDDPLVRGKPTCINFVRSVCSLSLDCQPGPIEQVNQITHWLDSSNIYGSTEEVAAELRAFRDGLLKTEPCDDNGEECLPLTKVSDCLGPSKRCSVAGDLRVNEQPTLSVMHQLWMRNHNFIARQLKAINGHWNDEKLFQESRRIVNAEFQHIVFNEFLPVLLGHQFLENFNLVPLTRGFSNVYRDDFDPRVSNAFSAAAFRIGHTFITSVIKMFKERTLSGTLDLKDNFNSGDIVRMGNNFDEILAGLTMQPSETYDTNFVDDITNNLFDDEVKRMDLISLNLQRARDHGIPGYIFYREICRSGPTSSFEDFSNNMTPESIERLRSVYAHIEDIDLFMGMTHERPCRDGALVGCTFLCIIGDNFARARLGDRFFYDLPNQPHSFTEAQLNQIRRISLARIICDNSKIRAVSPLVFRQPNPETNPITVCASKLLLSGIPTIDFTVFKDFPTPRADDSVQYPSF